MTAHPNEQAPPVDFEDAPEHEPFEFWVQKQRELLTSVVDYNLQSLTQLVTERQLDISPRYQRRFRWDQVRQSRLIESLLMNVPIPPVFLNEDEYGVYSVIDGKQRITSIHQFMSNKLVLKGLEVFSEVNNLTYSDLPSKLQSVIRTRPTLRAIIVLRQSDPDIKYEVFRRLNTGGVKLNAQEIRNSVFAGPMNDMILDVAESQAFHRILHIKQKAKSALYQEMKDAELALRFLTFAKTWENFGGGMRRNMDKFMDEHHKVEPSAVEQWKTHLLETIARVHAAFGEHTFQRWLPDKQAWRAPVVASLYDAQMFAVQYFSVEKLENAQGQIETGYKQLFGDAKFRQAVDSATNTPSFFRQRIYMIRDLLAKYAS